MAVSPDDSLLAFADTTEIHLLQAETRTLANTLRQLPEDTKDANPLDFRHGVGDTLLFLDDHRIATTGMGGLVSLWDVRSGRRLSVIEPPSSGVVASTLDYSPVTNHLIVGTSDGDILLTHISGDTASPLMPVAKLGGYIWDLQFGPDGRYFASAAANASSVAIWDAETLEKVGDLDGAREVYRLALVPGEKTLVTAGEEIRVWEFFTREQLAEVADPNMVLQGIGVGAAVAVTVLGVVAGAMLGVPFIDPATQLALLPAGVAVRAEACSRSVAVSPDGKLVVTTTRGPSANVMAVVDRSSDKVVDKWLASVQVCDMEFSPNGKYLLTATDRGVQVYDTADWKKTNLKAVGSD